MATWRRVGAEFRVHILKQENFTMNNSRKFGVRRLCVLSLMTFFSLMLPAQQDNNSTVSEDVVIRETNYSARISKDAFIITVSRGDEVVFQTGGPQDSATNLDSSKDGRPQRVSRLKKLRRTA